MENSILLQNYSPEEKAAYLQAIASLATADRAASPEELDFLTEFATQAGLSELERTAVLEAAKEEREDSLPISLEILKSSELRFSLVADLIQFANLDDEFSADEKANVEKIADYLGVNKQQYEALGDFVQEASEKGAAVDQSNPANFLSVSGIQEKLKAAGIDVGSLAKGFLGVIAPLILGKMMGRRGSGLGGGLGSLISGLGAGRGTGRAGGLLGNILSQLVR